MDQQNSQVQINAANEIINRQAAMIRRDLREWQELLLELRVPFEEEEGASQREIRKVIKRTIPHSQAGCTAGVSQMSLYACYADDGPLHPGAQDMARTAPWRLLYIFDDYQTFRRWEQSEEFEQVKARRRNARFLDVFGENDEDIGGVINMRAHQDEPEPRR